MYIFELHFVCDYAYDNKPYTETNLLICVFKYQRYIAFLTLFQEYSDNVCRVLCNNYHYSPNNNSYLQNSSRYIYIIVLLLLMVIIIIAIKKHKV